MGHKLERVRSVPSIRAHRYLNVGGSVTDRKHDSSFTEADPMHYTIAGNSLPILGMYERSRQSKLYVVDASDKQMPESHPEKLDAPNVEIRKFARSEFDASTTLESMENQITSRL